MNFSPERTISPIHNGIDDNGPNFSPTKLPQISPTKKITPPRDIDALSNNKLSPSHRLSERFNGGGSPLQSFNSVMDRISPKNEKKVCLFLDPVILSFNYFCLYNFITRVTNSPISNPNWKHLNVNRKPSIKKLAVWKRSYVL